MRVVQGNKLINLSKIQFDALCTLYSHTVVDLGTGDGRFVFKEAQRNSQNFYIGIDPSEKQLEIYSKKAQREKLNNLVFVLASVEMLPKELMMVANDVNIILPWGSLLSSIVKTDPFVIKNIADLLKPKGILKIVLGYTQDAEPSETKRLDLDNLSEIYVKEKIVPAFEKVELVCTNLTPFEKADLKDFKTTWSNKLSFGKDRPIYFLNFKKLSDS